MRGGRVPDGVPPQLRADARRNRRSLIDAAARIFAEQGGKVPMERIARAAGVGVGTLYRHFPDRATLLHELAIARFADLHEEGLAAEREEPTAWDALLRFCDSAQNLRLLVRLSPGHSEREAATADDPELRARRQSVLDVLDRIVAAAQAEGSMRPDVGAGDVAVMLALVLHTIPTMSPRTARLAEGRTIRLMLAGLRADAVEEWLPGRAITTDDLGRAQGF